MKAINYQVSVNSISCFFEASFFEIEKFVSKDRGIIITDTNVLHFHASKFEGWKIIVINAGEKFKQQATADYIIGKLIELQADRDTIIIGIGGGVVTDISGYVASVYMRGLKLCLVPTSILAMVDAAIGGKNGVDVGIYKNLVGSVAQPQYLIYDYEFLKSLPKVEWVNGFAEIIKHACIKDKELFKALEKDDINNIKNSPALLDGLIQMNVNIKYGIVARDEFEKGERRLLNFGHTIGHAIENLGNLSHGHAISIGMVAACSISEKINKFSKTESLRIIALLEKYELPITMEFDILLRQSLPLLDIL